MDTYTPFKDRTLNPALPVKVYRNLHKDCYSVRQNGLVVGHTQRINLRDCTFHVSAALRDKVRESRVKNVHALIQGYVTNHLPELNRHIDTRKVQSVYYNPHCVDTFVYFHLARVGKCIPIHSATEVKCSWDEHSNRPNVRALLED